MTPGRLLEIAEQHPPELDIPDLAKAIARKALAALIDKATPGPWRVDCVGEDEEMVMRTIHGKPSAGGSEVCIVTTGSYDDATEAKNAALIVAAVNALPALLDELAAARRDAEDIRRAGEILADAPGLPLELLDEKELSKWTDAITGLVILFTDAIDAARGER